ncbi:MAG: TIGR00730 family Rossman fold protein [Bradymonadaceae bacterium]|nr:TIGR00730 family Rossman fold protein [Lujinxingiaceae bacterium]
MPVLTRICVFCGANPGANPSYVQAARAMGQAFVEQGIGLVYGGSGLGMMGAVANAVLEGKGSVIGVIPKALATREKAHHGLADLRVVSSMHERKALMAELADGFIALPGGMGTLEELCEIITWAQLGIHEKPIGLLNVDGYFDPLIAFFDHMVSQGYLAPHDRALICVESSPQALIACFKTYQRAPAPMWLDASES